MIRKVGFVGIVVNDIPKSCKFYEEILGLEPWPEGIVEMPGVKAIMFPVGNCSIELLQPTAGPDAPVGGDLARYLEKHGEGFCRLGLGVDDLDAETGRLMAAGFRILDTGQYGKIGEQMGAKMAFVHPVSTHGVLIELDQEF